MSTDLYLYGTWGIKNIHAKSLNPFSQLNFFNLDSNAVADVIHYPKKTLLREISYLASCLQSPTKKKGISLPSVTSEGGLMFRTV